MGFVFRHSCQILAFELIFQVFLPRKRFHLENEGGRKYGDPEGIAKLE